MISHYSFITHEVNCSFKKNDSCSGFSFLICGLERWASFQACAMLTARKQALKSRRLIPLVSFHYHYYHEYFYHDYCYYCYCHFVIGFSINTIIIIAACIYTYMYIHMYIYTVYIYVYIYIYAYYCMYFYMRI